MEIEAVQSLLPLAGKLTVIGILLIIIYFLYKEIQSLKARMVEKEEQLKVCIDSHLEDMRENYKDMQAFADKFNSFANELKDIIRERAINIVRGK